MQACRADSSRFSARKGSFPTFGASFQPFLAPAGPKGSIESIYVKDFGNTKVANISVATDYCYTTRDGGSVIETTWHYVTAWEGKEVQNLEQLKKGSFVHVMAKTFQKDCLSSHYYVILRQIHHPICAEKPLSGC